MPPPASKRRTSSTSFDRIEGEGPKAFAAFAHYRNMGPDRTLARVVREFGTGSGYGRLIERWSSDWNWVERARAFDNYAETRAREIAERYLPMWEQRRQASLERNLEGAARLRGHLREMMDHPITRETTKEIGGREVTVIEPARWNWNTVIAGLKMVAELEAATIAEGLLEADDFDVEAATVEQLKAFIRKHRPRRGGPLSGPPG